MDSALNRFCLIVAVAASLSACATSTLPTNFVYETSLRDEQGFIGAANRKASADALLSGGVVIDPNQSLKTALPDAQVKVRRWGLVYFSKNWKRYQAVLDADITQDGDTVKCRLASPNVLSDAPSLPEMRANDGAALQRYLDGLVAQCLAQAK